MSFTGIHELSLTLIMGIMAHAASSRSSDYPFFNDDDWKRYPSQDVCDAELDIIHEYKKREVLIKLYKMSLSANRNLKSSDNLDELRLVVIGKTGQGKSATANTLLAKVVFKEDYGHRSVTKKAKLGKAEVEGRKIEVYDTPGMQYTDMTHQKRTLEEITRIFTHYDQGVHAFLYVINLVNPRFTTEDSEVLNLLEETFGGNFLKYCILVFTHGNELQVDLDAWCTHQREVATEDAGGNKWPEGVPTSGVLSSAMYALALKRLMRELAPEDVDEDKKPEEALDMKLRFAGLINILSWRVVAIDNHLCSPYEAKRHRNAIFTMVDEMRAKNNPPVYTHAFFKEEWESDEMEMVEEIIARNPALTRHDLIKEVNKWLREKN